MTQLIDAAEDFATLRTAMTRARHTTHTIGWAIDSRLQLVPGGPPDGFPPRVSPTFCARSRCTTGNCASHSAGDFAMLYA
jgi:hypothetical protein